MNSHLRRLARQLSQLSVLVSGQRDRVGRGGGGPGWARRGTHARRVFLRLVVPPSWPSASALLPVLCARLLLSVSVETDGEAGGRPEVDELAAALDDVSLWLDIEQRALGR